MNYFILMGATIIIVIEFAMMSIRKKYLKRENRMLKYDLERSQWLAKVVNEILSLHISKKSFVSFLWDCGYKNIVLYGMGELGIRLSEEILLNSSINILYGLDRNAAAISYVFPVYTLNEVSRLPKPDVIILTTYCVNDSLKDLITEETGCRVIGIEEIIDAIR